MHMLDATARTIISAAGRGAGLDAETIAAMLAIAAKKRPIEKTGCVLLTQAQKARQLGVSRFTIRKLMRVGRLHPIELLPGLLRYRADELV